MNHPFIPEFQGTSACKVCGQSWSADIHRTGTVTGIAGDPGIQGFTQRLLWVRELRGKSHQDMAEALGVTVARYKHYEAGEINLRSLRRLVIILNVSADYLLDSTEYAKP